MGQYYKIVNLDKQEYLVPWRLGDGLKLWEFGTSGDGTMAALALLLADGNGMGGGDLYESSTHKPPAVSGRWAGDRIVVAGDYAEPGRWKVEGRCFGGDNCAMTDHEKYCKPSGYKRTLYAACKHDPKWKDISAEVRAALESCGVGTRDSWSQGEDGKPEFKGTATKPAAARMRPDKVIMYAPPPPRASK